MHGGFDNSAPLHALATPSTPLEFTGPASASGVHRAPDDFSLSNEFDVHPSHRQQIQLMAARALRNRLRGLDLQVIPNRGVSSNESLEVALLQSRGVPLDSVEQVAGELHFQLVMRDDALGYLLFEGQQCLCEYGPLLQELVAHVFGGGNAPPILFMIAQESAMPLLRSLVGHCGSDVNPDAVRHDTALLFVDQTNHCELVANTSGRPLSDVLRQLQMAPDDPRGGSSAAWGLHVAQAARPFEVKTFGEDGTFNSYWWKRGLQAWLVPSDLDQNLGPVMTAQAMARAQWLVDEFWQMLEREGAVDLGIEAVPGRGEMHRLRVRLSGGFRMGTVQVYAGRIIGLTLKASAGRDIVVDYDHPWSRKMQPLKWSRSTLMEYADELDLYDAFTFALRNCPEAQPGDLDSFAAFLRDLRRNGGGMRFEGFQNLFPEARQAYLRFAKMRDRQIDAAAVERAITIIPRNTL